MPFNEYLISPHQLSSSLKHVTFKAGIFSVIGSEEEVFPLAPATGNIWWRGRVLTSLRPSVLITELQAWASSSSGVHPAATQLVTRDVLQNHVMHITLSQTLFLALLESFLSLGKEALCLRQTAPGPDGLK